MDSVNGEKQPELSPESDFSCKGRFDDVDKGRSTIVEICEINEG
jgi:hypothetical protein